RQRGHGRSAGGTTGGQQYCTIGSVLLSGPNTARQPRFGLTPAKHPSQDGSSALTNCVGHSQPDKPQGDTSSTSLRPQRKVCVCRRQPLAWPFCCSECWP